MGWFFLILVLLIAAYVVVTRIGGDPLSPPQELDDLEITVSMTYSGGETEIDLAPTQQVSSDTWLINPGGTFPLRIYPVDDAIAESVLSAIGDRGLRYSSSDEGLTATIAKHNIRCVEVDAYINQHKRTYRERIEELKASSSEWESASELDRKDLLHEFEEKSLDVVQVRPDVDLTLLLGGEPPDRTLDDRLVEAFGFEEVSFYLRHAGRLEKVHTVSADHARRSDFERLVKIGLARRGREIPKEDLLAKLKLKEMAALVEDLDAPRFTRKAKAIEYLIGVPDLDERLGRSIAFRELFQLKPLPAEFNDIDLGEVSRIWRYDSMIGQLLTRTYWQSYWAALNASRDSDVEGWKVRTHDDERCCQHCRDMAERRFSKHERPTIPFHLSCRCSIEPEY